MLRLLPLLGALLSSAAWSQAAQRPSDAPVRIGTFRGVERFEDPGHPVAGFHQQSATRKGMWIPGLSVFAASYLVSSLMLIGPSDITGLIPFAGAFIIADRYLSPASTGGLFGGLSVFAGAVAVVAGLAQLAGAALVVIGLTVPHVWLERDDQLAPQLSMGLGPGGLQLALKY